MPTCEFLTLRKAEPFAASEQFAYPDGRFMRILAVDRDWAAWEDTQIPGLKFAADCRSQNGPRFHSIVAMNEQSWLDADIQLYGREPRWARVQFMSREMTELLSYWALWPLLVGYTEEITRVRNSGANKIGGTTNVAKTLEHVGNHIAILSDMAAVATDLSEVSLSQLMSSYDGRHFKPSRPEWYPGSDTLLEMLVESITAGV